MFTGLVSSYAEVMVEAFLGNILGNTGKQYARILFEGIVIGMGLQGRQSVH